MMSAHVVRSLDSRTSIPKNTHDAYLDFAFLPYLPIKAFQRSIDALAE